MAFVVINEHIKIREFESTNICNQMTSLTLIDSIWEFVSYLVFKFLLYECHEFYFRNCQNSYQITYFENFSTERDTRDPFRLSLQTSKKQTKNKN